METLSKGEINERIQAENRRLLDLYKKKQILRNGIEMPCTYIDMGIEKDEVMTYYNKVEKR